jgi:hypothetical protein
VTEIKSFHEIASFYKKFVKNFSSITALLTKIMKESTGFKWIDEYDKAFNLLKDKLCSALVLALSDFTKAFKVECYALGICMGVVLM